VRGERAERRLAAILAADVAGYSRLIEADEEGTLDRLKALRAEIIDPKIASHKGRIVKTTGDGLLVEFSSVVDAVRCAAELQGGDNRLQSPADVRSPDRLPHRHSPGRHRCRGRGHLWRRRQCRRPARRPGRTRRHLRLGTGPRGRRRKGRPHFRGHRRPGTEKHLAADARLPRYDGSETRARTGSRVAPTSHRSRYRPSPI
jgi:hypothetical protein